jgi:hypothetical protein
MNLAYINVTFIGKVLRWKLYLQERTSPFTMFLEQRNINSFQMPYRGYILITSLLVDNSIVAFRPVMNLPQDVYDR